MRRSNLSRSLNKRLKLFIVHPTMGQGGADRVTLTLLQTLDRHLFDLSLILMRKEGEFLSDLPRDVKVHCLDASSTWTAWMPLIRLLRRHRPDIVLSIASATNIAAAIAHKLARQTGRLVISERNILFHSQLTTKRRLVVWLKRVLYHQADGITAVSQCLKDDMVAKLGLRPERISVVYNPVVDDNMRRLALEPVDHPWFREDIPIILGAGRLVPQKDFVTLIRAFKRVREFGDARLVILGEGPLRKELLAFVKARGLEDDVWLPGFDKNPFKYMARCTLFVLSSKHEGFSNVLIQAMSCGAPVISTDCPCGSSEIIAESGVDGILVPVGDVNTLAEQMQYLLDDPEVRRLMGDKARQSAERFRVDTIVKNYALAMSGNHSGT